MDLTDPTAFALAIAEALRQAGVEHALYGGLLLAAYGEARVTKDADLAVARADASATSLVLEGRLGLHCTIAFDRRPFGGLVVSLITLIEGEDLNTLDLVEPVDAAYAARALSRALGSTLREREIRVLTPEDFVIFKLLSTRELDLSDAASVVRALGSDLDSHLIRRELEILVRSIPSYPVLERWEQVRTFGLA